MVDMLERICHHNDPALVFFYIDRNLIARVYVQNFGYGLIMP